MIQRVLTAVGILALAAPMWAADVDGKWEGAVPSPRGEQQMTFDLKADGDKLTGTISNEFMGEVEIQDGKIEGDKISFKQVVEFGERKITFAYSGTMSGDEIAFKRTFEGGGGGGRGPGGPGGPGARDGEGGGRPGGGRGGMSREVEFTAKRAN